MKLCFVADLNSIHSQRWIRYFCQKGHQVYVLSTTDFVGRFENATVQNFSNRVIERQTEPGFGAKENIKKYARRLFNKHPEILIWLVQNRHQLVLPLKAYRYSKIARARIKRVKPDLVHCLRLPIEGYIGYLARAKPLVVSSWGNDFTYYAGFSPIYTHLTRKTMSRADLFFSDCQRDIELGIEYGFNVSKPHRVFPGTGGIDLTSLKKEETKVSYFENWGIRDDDIVLTSFRGWGRWYLHKPLLRAFCLVQKKVRNTKFILVGPKYGLYYNSLIRMTASLGLNKSVLFIDCVAHSKIPRIVGSSDLIISATSHDGTPNSMLETMAYGAIPVMSDIPSIREWVKDGWNGYLFNPRDPEDIAKVIVRALKNRDSFELMVKRNRSLVSERADYHKNMKLVEEMYRRLVSKAKTER